MKTIIYMCVILGLASQGVYAQSKSVQTEGQKQITFRNSNGWELAEMIPAETNFKVLLLPGLQGSDMVFRKLMMCAELQKYGIHSIAGNPPGFKGLCVPEGFDYSVESYAALYEKLAADENIDLIVGHSFSGNVLIEIAARGNYEGKLMMISPSLYRSAETEELLMLDNWSRKKVGEGLMWWLTYQMMGSIFKPYFTDKAELKAAVKNGKMIPRKVGRQILLGYFNHIDKHGNLTNRLLTTQTPVWYVRGTLDDIGFTAEDKAAIQKSSLVRYREVEGARHFAMIDKPSEVAKLIIESLGK